MKEEKMMRCYVCSKNETPIARIEKGLDKPFFLLGYKNWEKVRFFLAKK
jgi:hypothetical protein